MPGPAPKPPDQRARRNATVAMTNLPAAGRTGPVPTWPLGSDIAAGVKIAAAEDALSSATDELTAAVANRDKAAARRRVERLARNLSEAQATRSLTGQVEHEIWDALWRLPQAVQWERRGWFREVALFARHQAKAEAGSMPDATEARQREDRLGLNDMAMLRLRWQIVDDTGEQVAPRSKGNSSRYRGLKVVGGDLPDAP